MSGFPPEVQRGLALALEAERRGLLTAERLELILRYYDQEGGVLPAPAHDVLAKLGGLTPAQVAELLGVRAPALGEFQPRELTPRLVLLSTLGEGGMGTVYKAQDRVLRRVVAVKLIKGERLGSSQALQRFEREALTMARVQHPACVPVYEAGLAGDQPYLVMKYVPGRSLKDALLEFPLGADPKRVARWGQRLAEGLEACHEAGVIHRDVKPANALLDEQDQPLLTDFGVALDGEARTRLTLASGAVGTLAYMPPEQACGELADPRSDLYALGATLYEALTGRLPLEAEQPLVLVRKIAEERPLPPRVHRPDLPEDLERVVLKCLEKQREDRYPSAQALALDLARFLAGEPVSARPIGAGGRAARWARRRRRLLSGLGAGGLLLAAGLGLWAGLARQAGRRAALAQIAAASSAAGGEDALARLAAAPDPWVGARAEAALRERRLRALLGEAEAGLARLDALERRKAELARRLGELSLLPDERLAVSASPEKQERLRLRAEQDELPLASAEAAAAVERALLRAEGLGSESEPVHALRARLLERLARDARDPDRAEALFARARAADRLGGGLLAARLVPALLTVVTSPPGPVMVSRLELSPTEGVMRPRLVASAATPARVSLPTGDYLIEALLPGHLPGREAVALQRGEARSLELALPPSSSLGPLADETVWIPTGSARIGTLQLGQVPAFFVARTEVTLEAWRSLWLAEGRPPDLVPTAFEEAGQTVLSEALRRRYPVSGVSRGECLRFCAMLELELGLTGSSWAVVLPGLEEYHRAVRGELTWTYPWGHRFEPSLCACMRSCRSRVPSVDQFSTDRSVHGVCGLAGGVAEWGALIEEAEAFQFGGSAVEGDSAIEVLLTGYGVVPPHFERPDVGFRYILRPSDEPVDLPRPDPGVNWIRVAERHANARQWKEALEAARNHVALGPKEPQRWVERGRVRLVAGDTWGAWFDGTQATLLDPRRADAWHLLGQVEHARLEHAASVKACDRALELDPQWRGAWYTRGASRSVLGDVAGSIADAEQFLALTVQRYGPEHPDARMARDAIATMRQRQARDAAGQAGQAGQAGSEAPAGDAPAPPLEAAPR